MIVIIDYDVGNLKSVENAFKRIGIETIVSRDKNVILKAKGIVLPGVGTFKVAMKHLEEYGLIDILNERKESAIPILGICLGMQVLFENGLEVEETKGLGFIKGDVVLMEFDEKIPHMGWNQLIKTKDHPLLKNVYDNEYVYFVHSYMAKCQKEDIIATCQYGKHIVTAAVAHENVMGCQFHPEKSDEVGKRILLAFKEMIQ